MLKEVQNLPDNWEKVSIPDVLFFQEGPGVRKWQFTQEGVKLLNGGNINNNAINLDSTKIYISEEEAQGKYSHFMIDPGDLVIACSGIVVNKFKYKIAVIDQKHTPLCLNTSTMRFKSLGDIDLKYYAYFLQTEYFSKQLQRLITGSAQLNFGPSHIKKMEVLLPPLEEQKKIATILDAADEYRQKTKALIDKYDQLTQSLFLDMFGDPVTNPMGLPTIELGEACEFYSGKAWKKQELGSKGVKLIRISNLHKPNFPYWLYEGNIIERYKVENGDLLFSWAGVQASIDVYLYEGNTGMLNQHIYNLKPKTGIDKLFLFQLLQLNLNALRSSLGGGVGQFHLKKKDITSIKVLIPQASDMQLYLRKIDSINIQKQQAEASLFKAEELFSSMLQRAFKGELTN